MGKVNSPTKTDIVYRQMKISGNVMDITQYNAGFQKQYFKQIEIVGDQWLLQKEDYFDYRRVNTKPYDVNSYVIDKNLEVDWSGQPAESDKTIFYESYSSRTTTKQNEIRDTIENGINTRIILGEKSFYSIIDEEEKGPSVYQVEERYEEGLGLTKTSIVQQRI